MRNVQSAVIRSQRSTEAKSTYFHSVLKSKSTPLRPRILTTYQKDYHPMWESRTEQLPGYEKKVLRTWQKPHLYSLREDFFWAWRLFRTSKHYDAVLTGNERTSLIFALMQRLLRREKIPHILIDCLWNWPGGRWERWRKRVLLRWITSAVSRILVQSRREGTSYAAALGVRPEKFVFVPYHSTLCGAKPKVSEGDYIFAGGDSNRDYATLMEAVQGLKCRTLIAALFEHHFLGLDIPTNVEIVKAGRREFLDLMAGAAIVVVPLQKGLLHSGGEQTYENAMTLGKPVIVADECAAHEYIEQGVTGIVVEPRNPVALREAILALLGDRQLAWRLGQKAKEASAAFEPERFFERVFEIVEQSVDVSRIR
jgi:glycosyltransferase involved in cell wall biosynthesis